MPIILHLYSLFLRNFWTSLNNVKSSIYNLHIISTFTKTFLLTCFSVLGVFSNITPKTRSLDVLCYELSIKPDFDSESFVGTLNIDFLIATEAKEVIFDCGKLKIAEITGENVLGFEQKNKKVFIFLKDRHEKENRVQINYSGSSSYGLVFVPKSAEVYTVFSTSQWMVCNDSPSDRAKFEIELIIPTDKLCVASGVLMKTSVEGESKRYSWVQDYESPSYTYGFAVGPFNQYDENHRNTSLNYYATNYEANELQKIFLQTGEIINFFEAKSGIPYIQSSYSQILIGNHYQEMSGFSVLKESYGSLVLNDSTETNLISHELAHQWWGNMITCGDWDHFWLNEGIATFMSAAFNEYKFGKDKYESDINSYRKVYETVKKKGKDKALVFSDWSNPTREDRNLVYFKGAYVLHLLRTELGEKEFWNGIKNYSNKYFGRSVTTADFQMVMEKSTGRNLDVFFNKWVYDSKF